MKGFIIIIHFGLYVWELVVLNLILPHLVFSSVRLKELGHEMHIFFKPYQIKSVLWETAGVLGLDLVPNLFGSP